MILSLVWLVSVMGASWAGWLIGGRTETATLLMGIAMIVLSAIELAATRSGQGFRVMPAATLTAGAGFAVAGVFDRLNINRGEIFGDWLTGFLVAVFVFGVSLLPMVLRDRRNGSELVAGNYLLPHWDAVWLSLGLLAGKSSAFIVYQVAAAQGIVADMSILTVIFTAAWVLFAGFVQWSRYRCLMMGRLLLSGASVAILCFLYGMNEVLFYSTFPILFCVMILAGGGYPFSRPCGTFVDGARLLMHWGLTGMIVWFMSTNLSASLFDSRVSDVVASHEPFAPLSEAAFTRLVEHDAYLWYSENYGGDAGPLVGNTKLHLAERDQFSTMWRGKNMQKPYRTPDNPGVVVTGRNGRNHVAHVLPGSPAEQSGVLRGWDVATTERDDGGLEMVFIPPNEAVEKVCS